MLLAGERLLFKDIHMLEIKDDAKIIKYLEESDFVKIIDGKEIVIKNYNLFRKLYHSVRQGKIADRFSNAAQYT